MHTYKVNLLPPKLQLEGTIDFRRLAVIGGTTLFAAVILGGYGAFLLHFYSIKNDLEATKQQLASLAPLVSRVEGIKNERKGLEAALTEYHSILEKHIDWLSDLLSDLGDIMPVDLWLIDLDLYNKPVEQKAKSPDSTSQGTKAKKSETDAPAAAKAKSSKSAGQGQEESGAFAKPNMIKFTGFSRTVPSIGVFINNLHKLPYFKEIKLNKISAEGEGFKFEISAILRDYI